MRFYPGVSGTEYRLGGEVARFGHRNFGQWKMRNEQLKIQNDTLEYFAFVILHFSFSIAALGLSHGSPSLRSRPQKRSFADSASPLHSIPL